MIRVGQPMEDALAARADVLAEALRQAWGRDTSADPDGWSVENPSWGQCAVTALVIQDVLGGELLRCEAPTGSHYWNRLPDGREIDLTREQFKHGLDAVNVERRDRDYVLSFAATRGRYHALTERAHRALPSLQ